MCCASLSILRGESLNDEAVFLCDFDLLARCFEKLASACRRLDENMMIVDENASIQCDGTIGNGRSQNCTYSSSVTDNQSTTLYSTEWTESPRQTTRKAAKGRAIAGQKMGVLSMYIYPTSDGGLSCRPGCLRVNVDAIGRVNGSRAITLLAIPFRGLRVKPLSSWHGPSLMQQL